MTTNSYQKTRHLTGRETNPVLQMLSVVKSVLLRVLLVLPLKSYEKPHPKGYAKNRF